MKKQIIVTTSWDDGHKLDFKLAKLPKKVELEELLYFFKNREFREEDLLSDEEINKNKQRF